MFRAAIAAKNLYNASYLSALSRCTIIQELYTYKKRRQDQGTVPRKVAKEYSRPTIEKIGGHIYFIASKTYILNDVLKDPTLDYAKELTADQTRELPVNIAYIGPDVEFQCDEESFARLYAAVLGDFNDMQPNGVVSFPVGKLNIASL